MRARRTTRDGHESNRRLNYVDHLDLTFYELDAHRHAADLAIAGRESKESGDACSALLLLSFLHWEELKVDALTPGVADLSPYGSKLLRSQGVPIEAVPTAVDPANTDPKLRSKQQEEACRWCGTVRQSP